jgi:hypothetical protein
MPKYALLRQFDPATTRAQLDGLALQNQAALATYIYRGGSQPTAGDHGIRWIRSYWEQGGTWGMCLYESPDLPSLADFQEFCSMPFLEGREVVEIDREAPGDASTSAGLPRVALTVKVPPDEAEPRTFLAALAPDPATWLRAYWDPERRRATALYATPSPEGLVARVGRVDGRPATIVEITPEEYQ